ncbi:hypothetical protein TW95_gp0402 [Pandoravirus inopinatum]|uniref:Uncharacterized protein n=1 Tax=Pandoravirus inopinatum TaxID=1605721 RepID=A0A0B5J8M2_9VIRU|nr:hypothetical protein TW95_gp0402 [Pandoravirus inopinatum]AJF97136.1 hypothetical protein [Pandoravirus inopinatum]
MEPNPFSQAAATAADDNAAASKHSIMPCCDIPQNSLGRGAECCVSAAHPAGASNLESAPADAWDLDQGVADKLVAGATNLRVYNFDDDVLGTTDIAAANNRLAASVYRTCARLGYHITGASERMPQTFYIEKTES